MSPAARRALRFALALGSVLLVATATEFTLRGLGLGSGQPEAWRTGGAHQPDPELIYSMLPSFKYHWVEKDFAETATTNSLGLRGNEVGPKTNERKRIVVLGDSMTFGHGVVDGEPYPEQLDAIYRAAGEDIEVINAGIKGYGSDQAFKLFRTRLRSLEPDLLVFAYYPNDLEDNLLRPLYTIEAGRLVELDATENPLYRLGRIQQRLPKAARSLRLVQLLAESWAYRGRLPIPAGPDAQDVWVRRKLLLGAEELVQIGEREGFNLLILGLPYPGPLTDHYGWLERGRRGWLVFDLSRDRKWRSPGSLLYLSNDSHFSAKGHAVLARTLHAAIERNRAELLPAVHGADHSMLAAPVTQ